MPPYIFHPEIRERIRKLYRYDNYHGPLAVSINFLTIAFAIALSTYCYYFFPLTILVIGSRQRALATLLHEAAHGTLAKNKTLNTLLGTWCSGYLIAQGWTAYRKSHVLSHHTKLGNIKHDPDYQHYWNCGIYEKHSKKQFIVKYWIIPLLGFHLISSLKYLINHRILKAHNKHETRHIITAQLILFWLFSYFLGMHAYFLYWLLPYLTIFQILTWFIELSEHYPMVAHAKSSLFATRNRFSGTLEHLLTGIHGENFHLIHHLFPGIPFWRLKKAHHVLLDDPNYAAANARFGGIFCSSNFAKPMWQQIPPHNTANGVSS